MTEMTPAMRLVEDLRVEVDSSYLVKDNKIDERDLEYIHYKLDEMYRVFEREIETDYDEDSDSCG